MKILARYDFQEENPWSVCFSALPLLHDGRVYFAWGTREIRCLQLSFDGSDTQCEPVSFPGRDLTLPYRWVPFCHDGKAFLSCGNSDPADHVFPNRKIDVVMLSLDDGMKEVNPPEEVRQRYLCRATLREDADVVLDGYTMRYRNSRSYQCIGPDGTALWQEKHKGYRYTDYEVREGCVIFGTAGGYGGGLYCYRLSDGACLCAVDTKGTARYCWQNGLILTRGREGQLLWVDPFAGRVVKSMTLDARLTDDSGICADDRYVAAVGFHKKTSQPTLYLIDTED